MRAQVEPAVGARHLPGLRLLVVQQQRFVGGVEVHPVEALHAPPGQRLHEAHRIADPRHHLLVVGRVGRLADPAQSPVFRVVQVGESAIDQRTHEVHRHRRTRVRLHHPPRIGDTRLRLELRAIDDVAAVARQGHAVARLGVGRARLGILAGEPPHPHHRQLQSVHQHQAHLQQYLEPVGDDVGTALSKGFGTIAALQQEPPAFLCLGQLLLERQDLPRRHQRRQRPQLIAGGRQRLGVGIGRHLQRGLGAPARRRPVGRGCCSGRKGDCGMGRHRDGTGICCIASSRPGTVIATVTCGTDGHGDAGIRHTAPRSPARRTTAAPTSASTGRGTASRCCCSHRLPAAPCVPRPARSAARR